MTALDRILPRLICPRCGAALARARDGVACASGHRAGLAGETLDLVGQVERLSLAQRVFSSELAARGYERLREGALARLIGGQRWSEEVDWLLETIRGACEQPELLLDVPCGQANFTAALARAIAAPIVGMDLSATMLELASKRVRRERLEQVALVRADALALPLADASVSAISACGGLHLYPDVPRAISEMRRVLRPGGVVAGLTFRKWPTLTERAKRAEGAEGRSASHTRLMGVRAFDFDALGTTFREQGFDEYLWHGSRLIGWFSAR